LALVSFAGREQDVVGVAEAQARRQSGANADEIFGALDLGTNNCRLLVAKRAPELPGGFRVVDAFSRIVRLGEGLSRANLLGEAAMARAIEALHVCADKLARRGCVSYRGVATEASRRAANGKAFLARVARETGLELAAIEPSEEAALALAGCAPLLNPRTPYAVMFDIGGGSTEVMWLAQTPATGGWILVDFVSLPFGVIAVGERLGSAFVAPASYDAAVADIAGALADLDRRCGIAACVAAGQVDMLGTSGTVTTLSAMAMGLQRYVRDRVDGSALASADISRLARTLAACDFEERARHPCIGRERADLVVAGCAIVEAICGLWPVPAIRVADRGLREGILLGLMGEGAP